MSRAAFRQSELERVFRAANKAGSTVQIDLKTFVATVFPVDPQRIIDANPESTSNLSWGNYAPDGKENWDEE